MDYCENCAKNWSPMDSTEHDQQFYLNNQHRDHQQNSKANAKPLRSRHKSGWHFNILTSSLLLVLLATLVPISLASSTCSHREYWDMAADECVRCSKCGQHEIVIRPCQRHMDTKCKLLNTIEIDWSKSMASERLSQHHQHHPMDLLTAQASTQSEDELIWDWQLIALVLAVAACMLFFIGTALVALNYVRQWRQIKKQLDNDIEGLSQQLMARLATPSSDNSTIMIEHPSVKRSALGPRQIEVRCVYLEDILDGKKPLKDPDSGKFLTPIGPAGNVYINDRKQRPIVPTHKFG